VQKGDTVKVGQIIAKSSGFVSTNIHSSVSGKVLKIDNVIDASGYKKPSIIIQVEGDEWLETIDKSEELKRDFSLSQEEIINKVLEGGIVGLGGATFPSHVKLSIPKGKTAEVLIINGVECEPYLTSDHQLMMEKGEEILVGTQILMKALNVKKAFIGIENNKPDAIKHVGKLSKEYGIETELILDRGLPSERILAQVKELGVDQLAGDAVVENVEKHNQRVAQDLCPITN
jgi:electron transport complex protein RnfC